MKLETNVVVNAPARSAWSVLAEHFADLDEWSTSVDESWLDGKLGVGAVRTWVSSTPLGPIPPSIVSERLLHFDRAALELAYAAETGLPQCISRVVNRWRVAPLSSNSCRIINRLEVQLVWWARPLAPLLRRALLAPVETFTEDLTKTIGGGGALCKPRQRRPMTAT